MNPAAVVLLLLAAFAHAGWNIAAKRIGATGPALVWLYQTVSVALYLPVAVLLAGAPPRVSWVLAAVVSAVLHNAYSLVLQRGYAVGDLSIVYPVARGSGPVLSVLAAVPLLGERPSPAGLAGAAAVLLGVLVIGLSPGSSGARAATSVRHGLLTGASIAAFTLWDAYSVTSLAAPPLSFFAARAILQSLMLTPSAVRRRHRVRRLWRAHRTRIVLVAALGPLASVLVLHALRLAPVSLVAPVREVSIVVGGMVAWLWLGEPDPARRLTGAAIVLAGIAVIALSG